VSPTTSHDLRCPRCSAHTPPGADWCTLCFADLRPPAAQEAPADPAAVEAVPDADPTVADPTLEQVGGGNGKHARAATSYDDAVVDVVTPRDPAEIAKIEARADEMLAMLAAESSNPLGPLTDHLTTTHSRIVAGLIGLVLVSLLGWLVMTVLGHLV
jgi:hypothetical protein